MATMTPVRPRSQGRVRDVLVQARATTYPLLAIVGLVIWFSTQSDRFLTVDNGWTIGRGAAVLMLVALAGTVVILIGSIDLSVAGNVTVSGIVCAELIDRHGLLVAIAGAIAVGAAIGLVNATILLTLKIPSFLVTLGLLSVLTGIANTITKGAPVTFLDQGLPDFINGSVVGIPTVILLTAAIAVVVSIGAFRTKMGRYLYAIGGGEPVAAVSGVPIARYKILTFVVGGALCGIAGVFITGQIGAGTADVGSDLLLDSIAAVVMGGTALSGGVGGPQRTILGVLVIAILSNGMDIIGVGQDPQSIVKGFVIIAAVALSMDRSRASVTK
jgi:ribose transport system permease protein/putative xylitol transport system permease protein